MKAVGVLLLLLGLVGLVLVLILWLPAKFNLVLVIFVSVACLAAVWGGGRLSRPKMLIVQPEGKRTRVSSIPPAQRSQPVGAVCPKCGSEMMPGQQFCGGCGSSLVSYCARCGNTINEPSRFCGRCGVNLG